MSSNKCWVLPWGHPLEMVPVQVSKVVGCDLCILVFGFLRDGGFVSGSLLSGSYFSVNRSPLEAAAPC